MAGRGRRAAVGRGAFYYLRIVKLMYFDEPTDSHAIEAGGTLRAVLSANGVAVLAFGVFPSR